MDLLVNHFYIRPLTQLADLPCQNSCVKKIKKFGEVEKVECDNELVLIGGPVAGNSHWSEGRKSKRDSLQCSSPRLETN